MIEIWARVIKEQKIVTDFIYKSSEKTLNK